MDQASTTKASEGQAPTTTDDSSLPRTVAIIGAFAFLLTGAFAMAAPRAFFDAVAVFDPYNQHFVQDIGAFNLGLGAVLVLASRPAADALFSALAGAATGAGAHVLSHLIGMDLGGTPAIDLPIFAGTALVLGWAALVRRRDRQGH